MTLITLHTVNCDGNLPPFTGLHDHAVNCPGWIGNEDSPLEARRAARAAGWRHEVLAARRYDFSPQCWARRTGGRG